MKKSGWIWTIVIAVIVIAAIGAYFYYYNPNQPAYAPSPTPSPSVVTSNNQTPVPTPVPQPTYIKTITTALGVIAADSNGMTLYTKSGDSGSSSCYSSCAATWSPVLVSDSVQSTSSLPGTLGTITRTDGTKQATYNNLPLYTYSGDIASGNTNGNNFNGIWSVVVITAPPAPAPAPSSSGYGY